MRLRHLITSGLFTQWSPLRRLGDWCHSYNCYIHHNRYSVKEDYDDAAEISLSFSCSTTDSTTGSESEDVCSVVAVGWSVSPFGSRSADEVLRCECGARGLSRIGEVLLAMIPLVEVERVGWPACAGGEAWGILHTE